MKLIFVSGPFRADSSWGIECNIRKAEELALEVWKLGVAALCPHCNTRFFQGAAPDQVWIDGDLEMLSRCDGMIVVDEYGNSSGTLGEIKFCKDYDIPVFYNLFELEEWLNKEDNN